MKSSSAGQAEARSFCTKPANPTLQTCLSISIMTGRLIHRWAKYAKKGSSKATAGLLSAGFGQKLNEHGCLLLRERSAMIHHPSHNRRPRLLVGLLVVHAVYVVT